VVHADKLKKCHSQLHKNEAVTADSAEVGTADEPHHFEAGTGDTPGQKIKK